MNATNGRIRPGKLDSLSPKEALQAGNDPVGQKRWEKAGPDRGAGGARCREAGDEERRKELEEEGKRGRPQPPGPRPGRPMRRVRRRSRGRE